MKKLLTFVLLLLLTSLALADEPADLSVALLDYRPSPVQPGQTFDLFVEVSNSGDTASNAWVEIIEEHPFKLLESKDLSRAADLGSLTSPQKLQFRLRIDQSARDGFAPLTIRYGASSGRNSYQEETFDIDIQTFDATIGLVSVEQVPEMIRPGAAGELRLTFTNYDDQPLQNIDAHLDFTDSYDAATSMNNIVAVQAMVNARLEEVNRRIASGLSPLPGITPMMSSAKEERPQTAFALAAPVGLSTQNRIPRLEAGETYTLRIPMRALPEAPTGIHAIPVYLSYNDEENNPYHTRVEIPLLIDMEEDLFVQIGSTPLRSTDFAGSVTLTVANRAQSTLRFATIELLESETYRLLTAPSEVYLGTLEPGRTENATFFILPEKERLELPVKITYRDTFNNEKTEERTLSLEIINRNYYRDMPYEMMAAWLIAGLVFLALVLYLVKKRK